MTDLDAAPDSLLKFVQCVTACEDCHGEGCNDSEEIVLDTEEETGSTDAGSIFNT